MIQSPQHIPDMLLDHPEIDSDARVVEFAAADKDPDDPVVPVQARAVAGIAPQRMGRGEMGFHIDFEDTRHVLSLPDRFGETFEKRAICHCEEAEGRQNNPITTR
jgi:hypothetical protein